MIGNKGAGFSIIEVMIFIAASGLIFVGAIVAINGRQQQVQFAQSVREFDAKIRDVMNDVTTGYYPFEAQVNCTAPNADKPNISDSGGASLVGSNNQCLYVGKAIQFAPDGEEDEFLIYNLAGRRYVNTSDPDVIATTIDQTKPVAADIPGMVEEASTRFGLKVTKVFNDNLTPEEFGTVAILSNFEGSSLRASTNLSQSVLSGGVPTTSIGESRTDAVSKMNPIEGVSGFNSIDVSKAVIICLEDASNTNKKASVTIGGGSSTTTVLKIDDYDTRCD